MAYLGFGGLVLRLLRRGRRYGEGITHSWPKKSSISSSKVLTARGHVFLEAAFPRATHPLMSGGGTGEGPSSDAIDFEQVVAALAHASSSAAIVLPGIGEAHEDPIDPKLAGVDPREDDRGTTLGDTHLSTSLTKWSTKSPFTDAGNRFNFL